MENQEEPNSIDPTHEIPNGIDTTNQNGADSVLLMTPGRRILETENEELDLKEMDAEDHKSQEQGPQSKRSDSQKMSNYEKMPSIKSKASYQKKEQANHDMVTESPSREGMLEKKDSDTHHQNGDTHYTNGDTHYQNGDTIVETEEADQKQNNPLRSLFSTSHKAVNDDSDGQPTMLPNNTLGNSRAQRSGQQAAFQIC